jgi:Uncharacterized protein conserved in bacteria (DUF2188)
MYVLSLNEPQIMARKYRPLIKVTSADAGNLDPEEIRVVMQAVHVLPAEQGWVVKKNGRRPVNKVFATNAEAMEFAQKLATAKKVELITHDKTVEELNRDFYRPWYRMGA